MYYLLRYYILVCSSLFFYFSAQSQSYLPMLEDGKEWYLDYVCVDFCAGQTVTVYHLSINGDTTIGNQTYKRIEANFRNLSNPFGWSTTGFFSWMREDTTTGKVYTLANCQGGVGSEQLLFDFSLNVGDKISNCLDTAITCTNVSTITTLDGVPRRQMDLDRFAPASNPKVIEGLGGNYYTWRLAPLAFVEEVYLGCVLKDGVPIYGPCANLITNVSEAIEPAFTIRSFSGDDTQSFEISQLPMPGSLTVFDLSGRKIKELPVSASGGRLEVNGLGKGIYIYQLKSGDQAINKKFIRL